MNLNKKKKNEILETICIYWARDIFAGYDDERNNNFPSQFKCARMKNVTFSSAYSIHSV